VCCQKIVIAHTREQPHHEHRGHRRDVEINCLVSQFLHYIEIEIFCLRCVLGARRLIYLHNYLCLTFFTSLLNSLNLIISSVNETESNLQEGGTFSVNNNQTTTCGSVDLVQEGGTFSHSGGDVSIQAANTNNPNVPASDVVIAAGSGTNKIGGSGGDVFVLAGNAAGGEFYS